MYRCYNPKRFFMLLIFDAAAVILLIILSAIGKHVFSADIPEEGVFLPVIMYQSITPDTQGGHQVTAAQLEDDLKYLAENGYETVSAAQLVNFTNGREPLPEHPVMLTFDGGFYDVLSLALPLLEKYNMCAVVAIAGTHTEHAAENGNTYLSWENVEKLLDSGRVEIGSFTYDLHSMDDRAGCSIRFGEDVQAYTAMLTSDLQKMQLRMEEETGTVPRVFSYPHGYICKESIPVLQELGFLCTFTCYERPNYITREPACLYGLDRYNRNGNLSTEEFMERALAG